MIGRIHSLESFGAVDGPGIRFVIFMQGCPMRCAYCHNPDTWEINSGTEMSVSELLEKYKRNRCFYTNGGITVTGGEPLLQLDFLIELFHAAKEEGISTCLDTSGICFAPENNSFMDKLSQLISDTDLVMLDIKQINDAKHRELTGHSNRNILAFAEYLSAHNTDLWVRHVVVPGITDGEEDLLALGQFLAKLSTLKAIDVLPYHTMGISKYEKLNLPYRLKDVPALSQTEVIDKKKIIIRGMQKA